LTKDTQYVVVQSNEQRSSSHNEGEAQCNSDNDSQTGKVGQQGHHGYASKQGPKSPVFHEDKDDLDT